MQQRCVPPLPNTASRFTIKDPFTGLFSLYMRFLYMRFLRGYSSLPPGRMPVRRLSRILSERKAAATQNQELALSPARTAVRLALPCMVASVSSSLCALLDALLLARRGAGTTAALSACLPVLTAIQTIGFTLGTGAGSHISRCLGSRDRVSAAQAAQAAFWLSLLLSVPLCGAGLLFRAPLMRLLGASGESAVPAASYAFFVLISGPLLCFNLVLGSLLRGLGQAGAYAAAYVLGAAASLAVQLTLIGRMGIPGSGIAMLTREGLTLLLLLRAARKTKPRLLPRAGSIPLRTLSDIMRSGLPVLIRQGLASVCAAASARTAASFGGAALAGLGLAARAGMLVSAAAIGFSQGFQPVCGHAGGRGDIKSAQHAGRTLLIYITVSLSAVGAAVYAFSPALLAPFQPEGAVLDIAVRALRAQSAVFFAQGAVIAMTVLTQALGMPVRGSIVAASRQGFVLLPLLLILPRLFGLTGLILCQSVSDVLSLALSLLIAAPAVRCSSCAPCGCSDARKAFQ